MYNKAIIFNLALQVLLLSRHIADPASDKSNEAKVLNGNWETAFRTALFDMDLDSTATLVNLEKIEDDPNAQWAYSYKYPIKCAFFRRVVDPLVTDSQTMDDKFTHNSKQIFIKDGKKVIFTNVADAMGEYIPVDFPLQTLSAPAAMAIALRLAKMSASLITGKGSRTLQKDITEQYAMAKAEAQALDERESFSFQEDSTLSEFVKVRMS